MALYFVLTEIILDVWYSCHPFVLAQNCCALIYLSQDIKKKKSKIKYSWKQKLYDLAGKSFMIWQPKVNKIKRLLPGCKKEKRAMFVVSDILNTTSYCISSECLSLQPTALEVRTKRTSLNSAQQDRMAKCSQLEAGK